MNARLRKPAPHALLLALLGALLATAAPVAAEVKIFRTETRDAFLEGTLEGIRVGPLGALELAVPSASLATLSEPFVFAAAGHPEGWVVGTGNSGKVLRVDAEGGVAELFAAPEPEVFAVWADGKGTVYAGSSPDGKVYRVDDEGASEIFDPEATYVWALAGDRKGRLLVATGLPGRLWRLERKGSETHAELLVDGRDSHVRSLAVLDDGTVLAGTAGQGLVLRVAPGGEVETLHDAVYPEVLTFAVAPGGRVYAALVASEASQVDLSKRGSSPSSSSSSGEGTGESGEVTVVVVTQGEETTGSRSASFQGPRSALVEITPAGAVEEVHAFDDATVHSLLVRDDGLWIGTGQEGRLYRYHADRLIQERVYDEQQIAALASGGAGDAVVTANGAALYRLGRGREAEGTYTSAVLDAGQVARFGSFLWEGSLPSGSGAEIALRSGMSERPDATWSEWSCVTCGRELCRDGEKGCRAGRREAALGELAHGRYVQWRATFRGGDASPKLTSAEVSYRQLNLRPKVKKLEVLAPGEILVPSAFNPGNQSFEPWSPNREGIFTTLRSEPSQNGDGRLKTLWKKGYRTLRWEAEDANDDELAYRLEFRPEDAAAEASNGGGWLPVASELDQDHYSFDATVLPDGVYRFRLVASDEPAHAAAEALRDERLSEPVVIDHAPPGIVAVERRGARLEVTVADELSPLRGAEVSSDAGEWRAARAADGLLDGRRETLLIEAPEDARMMLLRLTDAAFNVITFDLLAEDR